MLLFINVIAGLTDPIFTIIDQDVSGRDLILLGGGLFLLGKSTFEIHEKLEGHESTGAARAASSFTSVIIQIMLLDIVFSLDSVITAVGMADDIGVMIAAVIIAIGVMLFASGPIAAFVEQHPTVKMLALSFLLLIGMSLIAEGAHQHIPKGYIYFAMAFSVLVEMLNLRLRARSEHPVHLGPLNQGFAPTPDAVGVTAGAGARPVPSPPRLVPADAGEPKNRREQRMRPEIGAGAGRSDPATVIGTEIGDK